MGTIRAMLAGLPAADEFEELWLEVRLLLPSPGKDPLGRRSSSTRTPTHALGLFGGVRLRVHTSPSSDPVRYATTV
jgi:hypothetical protein